MRCRIMIPILLSCATIGGCAAASNEEETRTITLAHLKPEQAQLLIEPYLGEARIRATEKPVAVTITASGAKLDQIEELLRRYDVPSPAVRLRFQIIEADGFTTNDSAIAEVETALRELFRFR